MEETKELNGFVLMDKPIGMTSFSVLRHLKRILGMKKMGHGGTLDPGASGLMVVALGKSTKLLPYFLGGDKAYEATILFGSSTRTDDAESEILKEAPWEHITLTLIEESLTKFHGKIMQIPPVFSALHVDGKRAYELARADCAPVLASRPVEFYSFEILEFCAPILRLRVSCSGGTYIRSLARDLGVALGSLAHLTGLRRTQSSHLTLEGALSLESVTDKSQIIERLISPFEMMCKYPVIELSNKQCDRMMHGQPFQAPTEIAPGLYRVTRQGQSVLEALFEIDEKKALKIHRFATPS